MATRGLVSKYLCSIAMVPLFTQFENWRTENLTSVRHVAFVFVYGGRCHAVFILVANPCGIREGSVNHAAVSNLSQWEKSLIFNLILLLYYGFDKALHNVRLHLYRTLFTIYFKYYCSLHFEFQSDIKSNQTYVIIAT